jgi:hypothetical protein
VVIDIVQTTDTVSGRFAVGDRAATEFFGWLELIDRLDRAVERHWSSREARSTPGGSGA